jgi:hypothetical protein
MTAARLIGEADGLASLGLYGDAWEVLETLPPAERVRPAVLAVRLMVCQGLARWELGQEIARHIGPSDAPRHREAAGRFHLGHATALCAAGEVLRARAAVGALAIVWPEGRALALDSDALAAVW